MKGFTKNATLIIKFFKTDPVFSCTDTLFSTHWQKHKYYVLWNFGSNGEGKKTPTTFFFFPNDCRIDKGFLEAWKLKISES